MCTDYTTPYCTETCNVFRTYRGMLQYIVLMVYNLNPLTYWLQCCLLNKKNKSKEKYLVS